ncbi:MAG: glutathione S-transferase [Panacagrimonas sp.]|jgi:glutathione S-transferase|nr:glutathione S-transferase family protein [Panacagrimonas sp.]MCC2656270.1 glutathione S-transferase [Panacagrimonas sp.]
MILIGMFDSPYVRRVAVSLRLLDVGFEHRNWSVGKDFDRIREFNPLGRVPTLVLDDGEVLAESSAILDWLDEYAGPERALLPRGGADRRRSLQVMAIATGAADKGVAQLYEGAFRPPEKRHEPWVARCRTQMEAGLAALDRICAESGSEWLLGDRIGQVDITLAAVSTFLHESLQLDPARCPALAQRTARAEGLPAFREFHQPFFVPKT